MNKTKVDDILIEMISPQVKEIEEKFSRGEGLTQSDIHTLLLKSQYNHINHLDEKLNEVTEDVASLKSDFKLLEEKIDNKFNRLESNIKSEIADLKIYIEKTISNLMKWFIGGAGVLIVLLKLIDKIFS